MTQTKGVRIENKIIDIQDLANDINDTLINDIVIKENDFIKDFLSKYFGRIPTEEDLKELKIVTYDTSPKKDKVIFHNGKRILNIYTTTSFYENKFIILFHHKYHNL
jgi:hypothetical protein